MLHNLDQLRLQFERENLHEVYAKTCLEVLHIQFKEFFASKRGTWIYLKGSLIKLELKGSLIKLYLNMSKNVHINLVQVKDANLVVTESSRIESKNNSSENALSKSINETQMQMQEGKVGMESSGTKSDEQDTNSRLGNDADTKDAVIRPVNDHEPLAEVQLTAEHNVLANEQQHSVQSEPIYDTYLLEKVDSNITHDSTNMSHMGGEINQNAKKCQVSCHILDPSFDNVTTEFSNQSPESKNISLKKTVAQLQKDFSRMESHCVNMELKYQNQALKDGQHGQILNETKNEKLHKENEHLKQTYNDLYDSIKKTRVQAKDLNDSLIAQVNSKTIENADLKTQKCVFNANHDACLTKFLKEVNSRIMVPSPKTRNNIKLVEKKNSVIKPKRWISKGYRISLNKSFVVHEKPHTLRSCLRWKSTGRIFKLLVIGGYLLEKMFIDSTTVVDSEPPNGLNEDITNLYECDQTLNVSVGTLNLTAGISFNPKKARLRVWLLKKLMSKNQVPQGIHKQKHLHFTRIIFKCTQMIKKTAMASADNTSGPAPQRKESSGLGLHFMTPATSSTGLVSKLVSQQLCISSNRDDWDRLFQPMFDEYFNPLTIAISSVQEAAASKTEVLANSFVSISISQDAPSTIYGLNSTDSVDTPMIENKKLDEDLHGKPVDATLYRRMIGSFMYLTASRPDLSYVDSDMSLTVYADADHAGCQDTRRSTSGSAQFLGDKLSAIALCCNNFQHARAKHIDVRYHFIKKQVENEIVELYFVRTEYQLPDIFTKSLPRERFNFLIDKLGMKSMSSDTLKCLAKEIDE
nr:retrotransposon protein, putative, unclassified [Tanacetum cinerariifolium]